MMFCTYRKALFFVCTWCFPMVLFGQSAGALFKTYTESKSFLERQQYSQALSGFESLTKPSKSNIYIEFAHYFAAYAAYKNNDPAKARTLLENLLQNYPNCPQKQDALYLLGEVLFQTNQHLLGLSYLEKITDEKIKQQAEAMKGNYLQKLSQNTLKTILQDRPQDIFVAQLLVDKMAVEAQTWEDIQAMEQTIAKYNVQRPNKQRIKQKINVKEGTYNVAVILPLNLEGLKNNEKTTLSRMAVDLYQGMRLAKKELEKKNIKVDTYVYDLGKSEEGKLVEIIASGEMDKMDLIIGPVFENQWAIVSDYAAKQQINIVQPLTDDDKFLKNEYAFLMRSSIDTQAEMAARFALQNFPQKEVAIYYDNIPKNQRFAEIYRNYCQKMGLKVSKFQEVNAAQVQDIPDMLKGLNKAELGHLVFSTGSALLVKEFLQAKGQLNLNVPLMGTQAWLNFEDNEFDTRAYEKEQVYFVYPNLQILEDEGATNLSEEVQTVAGLAKEYETLTRKKPTAESFSGFEMLTFFVDLLQKYGVKNTFQTFLKTTTPQKGIVVAGFDYSLGNDNHYVPIMRIEEGQLKLLNKLKK
ncbi:MAG TPA: hypothetical protein DCM08_12340 [Microscillaceae bacterium]|nr:hypothetical protein [Microscillaceae bacterium]